MRRSSLALVSATGLLALAALMAPASSRAQTAQIICPLAGSQSVLPCCGPPVATASPMVLPCCGQPVATASPAVLPCCATPEPIACPAPLTIGSTPEPSTAGRAVTIAGRWFGGTAGTTVELWEKLPRSSTFKQVAHNVTGSAGQYQFVRSAVQTSRQWYVTVGATRSATVRHKVRAIVSLTRSLRVHVSPNHAGERVLIEKRVKQSWKVLARLRLGRSSSSNGPAPGTLGSRTIAVRAVFEGDARNVLSVSRVLTIRP